MSAIRTIVIAPDGTFAEREITPDLETLQQLVDGYIQYVPIEGATGALIVNEEGLLHGLPFNPVASSLAGDHIVGTAVVIGPPDEKGDETSISSEAAEFVRQHAAKVPS